MKRRIFIAINLPENIKNTLADYQKKWPDLPARWIKPENLHITLVFIGYVEEEEISEIRQILANLVVQHKRFFLVLDKISYGPSKIIPPRMVWASGELSKEFFELKQDLEKELSKKIKFTPEKREAALHITLARIKEWEWRRIEPEERPVVDEELNLSFQVASIEVMESKLKRGGAEYAILESEELGGL